MIAGPSPGCKYPEQNIQFNRCCTDRHGTYIFRSGSVFKKSGTVSFYHSVGTVPIQNLEGSGSFRIGILDTRCKRLVLLICPTYVAHFPSYIHSYQVPSRYGRYLWYLRDKQGTGTTFYIIILHSPGIQYSKSINRYLLHYLKYGT